MNHIYKVVFCKATNTFVAVTEYARAHGKSSSGSVGSSSVAGKFSKLFALTALSSAVMLGAGAATIDGQVVGTSTNGKVVIYNGGAGSGNNANMIIIGDSASTGRTNSIKIGTGITDTDTGGGGSVVVGNKTHTGGGGKDSFSVAVGNYGFVAGPSVAIGAYAKADPYDSTGANNLKAGQIAIGAGANTGVNSNDAGMAIGTIASARSNGSVAVGRLSLAGTYAANEGFGNGARFSTAIGEQTTARGYESIALGGYAMTGRNVRNQGFEGAGVGQISSGAYAIAIGGESRAINRYTLALGQDAIAGGYTAEDAATVRSWVDEAQKVRDEAKARYDAALAVYNSKDQNTYTEEIMREALESGVAYERAEADLWRAKEDVKLILEDDKIKDVSGAIAVGTSARALNKDSIAFGTDAKAHANQSIAIGTGAKSTLSKSGAGDATEWIESDGNRNRDSIAIGTGAITTKKDQIVIGTNTHGGGNIGAVIIGANATGETRKDTDTSGHARFNNPYTPMIQTGGYSFAGAQYTEVADKERTGVGSTVVAIGRNAGAVGGGVAVGDNAQVLRNDSGADRTLGIAIGGNALSYGGGVTIGAAASTEGINAVAVARQAVAKGESSQAYGVASAAVGDRSLAMGTSATSIGVQSIAIGSSSSNEAYSKDTNATAEGENALAVGTGSRVGRNLNQEAVARPDDKTRLEWNALIDEETARVGALTANSIAIGTGATVESREALLEGTSEALNNTAKDSIAIGTGATVKGNQSIAIGTGNLVTGDYSSAIGDPNLNSGTSSHVQGNDNAIGNTTSSAFILGNNNTIGATATYDRNGKLQTNAGLGGITNGNSSVAIGNYNRITTEKTYVLGSGINTIGSLGNISGLDGTIANSVYLGDDSHARGGNGSVKDGKGTLFNYELNSSVIGDTTTGGMGAVTNGTVNGVTYGPFAGTTPVGIVTVGTSGAERRIQNVAAGEISSTSTDAINGSQLYAVIDDGHFKLQGNGANVDDVKWGDTINFIDGNNTTVTVENTDKDKKISTIKIDVDVPKVETTSLTTNTNGKVNTPADGDTNKLATAGDIANAINNSGWNAKSGGNKAEGDNEAATLINPGEDVEFNAGTNLKVKRVGNVFTYETDKNVVFDSVKAGPVTINNNGIDAGNTAITNVKGNLPNTYNTDAYNPNNEAVTKSQALPENVNVNNAATVGDVLNAGWNLQGNGEAVDFVKPYDTVNFKDGANTKVVAKANDKGTSSDIQINVTGLPVQYTTAEGTPVAKVGDKYYPVDENGLPNTDADPVEAGDLITNVINPAAKPNEKGDETTLGNVKSGLETTNVPTAPTGKDGDKATSPLVDLTVKEDGSSVPNTNVATVGDLRNMGWVVSAEGNGYTDTVKNANEVKFKGTGLATVTGETTKEGVREITVNVDAQAVVEAAQQPVVYTNAEGDKLAKVGDTFYKAEDIDPATGEPKADAEAVKPADVIASMNNGDNSTTEPMTLTNIKSNLPSVNDADTTITNPDGTKVAADPANITKAPITAQQAAELAANSANNAATLGDVLNAGWNLQGNSEAVDFVKPFDTVNFVNGEGTVAEVKTDDNLTSTVTYNVNVDNTTTEITYTNKDGDKVYKVGDQYFTNPEGTGDAIDTKENPVTSQVSAKTTPLEVNKTGDEAGKVKTPANKDSLATAGDIANAINNSGWKLVAKGTPGEELINPSETVTFETGSDNLTVKRDGANIIYDLAKDIKVDSVEAGPVTINNNGIDAGNTAITNVTSGLKNTDVTTAPTGKDGDKATSPLVDLTVKEDGSSVPNTNVATVGDLRNMGWVVSAEGNGYTDTVKNANEVKFKGTGLATVTGETTKEGVREITVNVDAQAVVEAAQQPVVYTNAEGDKLAKVGDTFYKAEDIDPATGEPKADAEAVKPADVIASMNNGDNSTTEPMTLTNIKSNLPSVNDADTTITNPDGTKVAAAPSNITKAPITAQQAAELAKNSANNAATLGDVLNAGWNLQGNGKEVDFVKPFDTVNFVNGEGTVAEVKTDDNLTSTVTYNVNVDNTTTEITYTNKDGDKVYKVGDQYFTNPEGTGDAIDTKENPVTSQVSAKTTPLEVNKTGDEAGKVKTPANKDSLATAGDIANAINNSGWKLAAKGTPGEELINPSETVTFETGSDNLTVKRDGANIIYDLAKDIKVDSVEAGPVTINNNGIDAGNTAITNVKGNLDPTYNAGDNTIVDGKPSDTTASTPTKSAEAPTPDQIKNIYNNAATVGDVLNAGWNLKTEDQGDLDFVKPYDTVEFVNGKGTTVESKTDGETSTITYNVKVDGKTVKFDKDGALTAETTVVEGTVVNIETTPEGKAVVQGGDTNGNNATSAGSVADTINKVGFKATANKPDGADANKDGLVNAGENLNFNDGANTKVVVGGNNVTYNVTGLPVQYTTAGGTPVAKVGDNYYPVGKDGLPDTKAAPIPADQLVTNVVNPAASPDKIGAPTKLGNIASTLPATYNDDALNPADADGKKAPVTTAQALPELAPAQLNNAATIGDVLNAGWNLQNNGKARDFVKPYDTVNFVNGKGTTAVVTTSDDGTSSDVTYNVNYSNLTINGMVAQDNGNGTYTFNIPTAGNNTGAGDLIGKIAVNGSPNLDIGKTEPEGKGTTLVNGQGTSVKVNEESGAIQVNSPLAYQGNAGENDTSTPTNTVSFVGATAGVPVQAQNLASGVRETLAGSGDALPSAYINAGTDANGNPVSATTYTPAQKQAIAAAVNNATGDTLTNAANIGDVQAAAAAAKTEVRAGENVRVDTATGDDGHTIYTVHAAAPDLSPINKRLDDIEKGANAGVSSAMAMATLPQAYIPGKSMLTGGVASYNGEGAVAVGFSKLSDNGRWVLKMSGSADTDGNIGGAVGAGFHF